MSAKLTVTKIPLLNSIVIKQYGGRDFFIAAPDSIIISIPSFSFLLRFLVENGFVSEKILEGVLEEFNTQKGRSNEYSEPEAIAGEKVSDTDSR